MLNNRYGTVMLLALVTALLVPAAGASHVDVGVVNVHESQSQSGSCSTYGSEYRTFWIALDAGVVTAFTNVDNACNEFGTTDASSLFVGTFVGGAAGSHYAGVDWTEVRYGNGNSDCATSAQTSTTGPLPRLACPTGNGPGMILPSLLP